MTRLVREIRRISNEFCDLVLGPLPQAEQKNETRIIEVIAEEPEEVERYLDGLIAHTTQAVVIVGADAGYFEGKKSAGSVFIVPAETLSRILVIVQELVKSDAFDVIVVPELMLKPDYTTSAFGHLLKMKTGLNKSKTSLVLVNPLTTERQRSLSELENVCSHQIFYKDLKLRRS